MMKKFTLTLAIAVMTTTLTCPAAADRMSAKEFVVGLMQWAKNKPHGPGDYLVQATLVSNNAAGRAMYGQGGLKLSIAWGSLSLGGTMQFYYSNRQHTTSTRPSFNPDLHPFNPKRTDTWSIEISGINGEVVLFHVRTKKAYKIAKPILHRGVIYGFATVVVGSGRGSMFVISLKKMFLANPK